MFKGIESIEFKEASLKFKMFGPLGVTATDHLAIGSTPNEKLISNPGKTLGEIMSEKEITIWLQELQDQVKEYSSEECKKDSFARSILIALTNDLRLSKEYLLSINKLSVKEGIS